MNAGILGWNLERQPVQMPGAALGSLARFSMPYGRQMHQEAQNWYARLLAARTTASEPTMAAVDEFCRSVDNAGLRNCLYRVNLFCGANLTAALIPLFTNLSPSLPALGNATDVNQNFVSANFVEYGTGTGGGITSDGSAKRLNTGLSPSLMQMSQQGHLSVYHTVAPTVDTTGRRVIGTFGATGSDWVLMDGRSSGIQGTWGSSTPISVGSGANAAGHWLVTRRSTQQVALSVNGAVVASSNTQVVPTAAKTPIQVFATENQPDWFVTTLGMYSIGTGMSVQQAVSFYAIVKQFMLRMKRAT